MASRSPIAAGVWLTERAALLLRAQGFDLELVQAVVGAVNIPVIASSGAGRPEHFTDCFEETRASAALAAGIFHREEVAISDVKAHMAASGLPTRVTADERVAHASDALAQCS